MYSDKFPVKAKGIGRVFKAFLNSINGLRAALRHEQAFQQEVVLGVLCIIAIPFLQTSALESAILIVAVVLVWITELLNSGLEWTIDYISEEAHPYAKSENSIKGNASDWCRIVTGRTGKGFKPTLTTEGDYAKKFIKLQHAKI